MKIRLSGVAPHVDGEYDASQLTNRELHEIKRISGVRPSEILEALVSSDAGFAVAVALVATRRAGKLVPEDVLFDKPAGAITFVLPDVEVGEEIPPTEPKRRRGKTKPTSGSASRNSSASPEDDPKPSGART